MKNLECSSSGDKRFSAFYAFVNFNGKYASIEQHYQKVKFNKFDKPCCKGEHIAYICINNKKLPATYLIHFFEETSIEEILFNLDCGEYKAKNSFASKKVDNTTTLKKYSKAYCFF